MKGRQERVQASKPGVQSEDGANWLISYSPLFRAECRCISPTTLAAFNESLPNRRVRETHVSVYACPSDFDNDKLADARGRSGRSGIFGIAIYAWIISGRDPDAAMAIVFWIAGTFATYPQSWRGPIHAVGAQNFHPEKITQYPRWNVKHIDGR